MPCHQQSRLRVLLFEKDPVGETDTAYFGAPVAERGFFVSADFGDYDSAFSVVNGEVLYYEATSGPGYSGTGNRLDDLGMCTKYTCHTAKLKAVLHGERLDEPGGDLLVMEAHWANNEEFYEFPGLCPWSSSKGEEIP